MRCLRQQNIILNKNKKEKINDNNIQQLKLANDDNKENIIP